MFGKYTPFKFFRAKRLNGEVHKARVTIGGEKDLARTFAEPLIKELNDDMRRLLDKSFPQFGISLDGTPSFAEAECIMVRFVTMVIFV